MGRNHYQRFSVTVRREIVEQVEALTHNRSQAVEEALQMWIERHQRYQIARALQQPPEELPDVDEATLAAMEFEASE